MECVTTTSYSLVLNGQYHGFFKGQRELRRGDPLSPFLFTLCLEALSRSLKRMSRSTSFGYHPKCCNLHITHLAYADDLLLLSRGDVQSVKMIINCLNEFGDIAGLRVNNLKSCIYMASIDDNTKKEIIEATGFTEGVLPFRYLGIPLAALRLQSSDYGLLVDTIAAIINSWPRHSLSHAGKMELIRSVIQGVECFWLSILPLPSIIIDWIYAICRKFVWPSKHPPIAWKLLCRPLSNGGLGLKNLRAWNNALIAKTLRKIHLKKDSLWIKWVNHVYSCFGNVWQWQRKRDDSLLIKQIVNVRDMLIQKEGSIDSAIICLNGWFNDESGASHACAFFIQKNGRWPWKPLLSKSLILPKHRFALWLFAHAKLLTRDRLPFVDDKICALCRDVDESVAHLFFDCKVSKQIWNDVRVWLGMKKSMGTAAAVLKAFRTVYRGNSCLIR